MHTLPKAVYNAAQVRALDRYAIDAQGVPGYALMCRAGASVLQVLRERYPEARRLRVWCGAGNNAGDGYVIARLARAAGLSVQVVAVVDPQRLRGDARHALEAWLGAGGATQPASDARVPDVEVDALLGTGLDRAPEGGVAEAIEAVNASPAPVVAVDLPSGVLADSGAQPGVAVRASLTVTFIGLKTGLFTGAGVDCVGALHFDPLGVDAAAAGVAPAQWRLQPEDLHGWLAPRARGSHKGSHGSVLVVGGGRGMPGAVRLAAEAALRAGAGLVRAVTRPEHVGAVAAARPEIICEGAGDGHDATVRVAALAAEADAIALGPGLGQDAWARALWRVVLDAGRPTVVDADALNLIDTGFTARENLILTPHPGEAARLLGTPTAAVQRDRPVALEALLQRFGGVVVLKGAGTLTGRGGDTPWLCTHGNAGMATAGSGDVLTGVVAAFVAQGLSPWRAARAGVLVHAMAGDAAARRGQRGMIATDLIDGLRACVNPARA